MTLKNNFLRRFIVAVITVTSLTGGLVCQAQTLAEALDTTNLVWFTGGDAAWFGQTTNTHDGFDAAQSPTLSANQTSWLETTVVGPGTVSVWVASYGNSPVNLSLIINGSPVVIPGFPSLTPEAQALLIEARRILNGSPHPGIGSAYGQVNPMTWSEYVYDLGAGTNVLRWTTTNSVGSSEAIFLDDFRFDPARPLSLAYQPWAGTIYSGAEVQLTAAAIGTPPFTYQWLKNGMNLANATNDWLRLESVSTNDAGNYSIIVSNSQGFVTSSNALLTVLPPTAPFFTSQPASATAYSGQYISRYAAVSGSPPFAFQWSKDGTNISSATNANLQLLAVTTNDTGAYAVTVSNSEGFATSSNVWLTILPPTAPIFTREPVSDTDYSGASLALDAAVKGSPPFFYQWNKNGTNIVNATNAWLVLATVTTNDAGAYAVTVSNTVGFVTSSNATLTVLPPTAPYFIYEPDNSAVYSGEQAYFYAAVSGSPPFTYQWFKDGTNFAHTADGWLNFTAVTTNDAGSYAVTVSNAQGFVSSSNALLTVFPPAAPFFNYEPASVTAYTGGNFQLYASVSGSPPFAYQWRRDGTNLPNGYTTEYPNGYMYGNSRYFGPATLADAGNYSLLVSNAWGWIESSNAVVTVIASSAPTITRQPRSLEVAAGVNTWLSLAVTGTPNPYVTWNRTDVPPASPLEPYYSPNMRHSAGEGAIVMPTPINNSSYGQFHSLNNITTTDAGVYVAEVSNLGGNKVSRDALLTVLPPISPAGSWTQGAVDIFVTNGLAYLAQGTNGFSILNVSNPAAPVWLGGYNTPGYAAAIRVADGLAFVADGSAVKIFSVTNPATPVLLGSYATAGSANDLVVRSNRVFVANGNSGLAILDVSNPAVPTLIGSYATNLSPSHICLAGNIVYLTALSPIPPINGSNHWVGGMLVVDISNPAHPIEIGRYADSVQATAARDEWVFVNNSVVSVTNPAQPIVVGYYEYPWSNFGFPRLNVPHDLQVATDLLYAIVDSSASGTNALEVFDIRDPSEPIPVGYCAFQGNAQTLWVDGQYIYVAGYDMPLQILKTPFTVSPLSSPQLSLTQPNGFKLQLKGRRGRHYSVDYTDGLTGLPWQPFQTLLLTNDTVTLPVSSSANARFFRLHQLD